MVVSTLVGVVNNYYCLLMKVSSYSVRACFGSVILVQLTMSFVATNYECARNHIVDDGCFSVDFCILESTSA